VSAVPVSTLTPQHDTADQPIVLFARQPILDAASTVQGHELLFRRADGTGWPIEDESKATAHVIVAAFADSSLGSVTGGTRAWINVPRSFLFESGVAMLPADRVVIELLERDEIDPKLVAHVSDLVEHGYQLALDDFVWHDDLEPLLELCTYVKLDVQALGVDGVAQHVQKLAPFHVRIVAEKVETAEERDACLELGIDLFQGYFFERPRLVRGRPAPHAALRRLRVATSLGPNASFEDVERVVMLDPGLSIRLLRYINSAALSLRSRVSSLRHALMLVGANTVRQWILLVMVGDLGRVRPAVLSSGLVRARLCEELARDTGLRAADSAFAVGLLSVCDALLDAPLAEIIEQLPLTAEVRDAIVKREGRLGELLRMAVALQHGEADFDARRVAALRSATEWADEQLAEFTQVS
jgi:EAL and modified HD-GYP domain-containing signal transduction protein